MKRSLIRIISVLCLLSMLVSGMPFYTSATDISGTGHQNYEGEVNGTTYL